MELMRGWGLGQLVIICLPAVYGADIYGSPGDTVTLPCDGGTDKDTMDVVAVWIFGSRTICSFTNRIFCEHRAFVNRTRLESIQENDFSLVISRVRAQDHGEYKCLINGAVMQRNRLFVRGGRKRRAAETPPEERLVCKTYEDKDKEVPDENPPGTSSGTPSSEPSMKQTVLLLSITVITAIRVYACKTMQESD